LSGIDAKLLGDQVPGVVDRLLLEIVAKGKIAQHLKEGVVARGVADIVQIIVLAAGAHAFLRGGSTRRIARFSRPGEHVLELHHAGIGEHQRRVVARHERRGRQDGMAMLFEVGQKRRPNFVYAVHFEPFTLALKQFGPRSKRQRSVSSALCQRPADNRKTVDLTYR
jgi:hypothetical protein